MISVFCPCNGEMRHALCTELILFEKNINKISTNSFKTQRTGYDIKTSIKKEKADLSESSSQENMMVQSEIKKEESETNAVQVIPEKKNTFFCD